MLKLLIVFLISRPVFNMTNFKRPEREPRLFYSYSLARAMSGPM